MPNRGRPVGVSKTLLEKIQHQMHQNITQGLTPNEMEELIKKIEQFYKEHPCEMDLFRLSKSILRRLKNDRDIYIAIEAIKGQGKSNLLVLILLMMHRYSGYYRERNTGEIFKVLPRESPVDKTRFERLTCSFDFEKNLSFLDQVQDLQNKFNSVDRYGGFGIDEGSKNLHKQNWQSKLQFKLVMMSDTERYQNKATFICIPNFKELNTNFRNDRIRMRIYLYVRKTKEDYASAVLSLRDPGRWSSDPWFVESNEKTFEYLLRKKPMHLRTSDDIIRAERKLKGYAGEIHIPNLKTLAPRIWETYMKYKITNAQRELAEEVEDETPEMRQNKHLKYAVKKMMAFIKLKFPGVKYADFSKLTNLPMPEISKIWRENIQVNDPTQTLAKVNREIRTIDTTQNANKVL